MHSNLELAVEPSRALSIVAVCYVVHRLHSQGNLTARSRLSWDNLILDILVSIINHGFYSGPVHLFINIFFGITMVMIHQVHAMKCG